MPPRPKRVRVSPLGGGHKLVRAAAERLPGVKGDRGGRDGRRLGLAVAAGATAAALAGVYMVSRSSADDPPDEP